MVEWIEVTGMVLTASPMGEYDKRVVILTKERGRITAFAKGARKQNSRLMAASDPFSFGRFKLYEGRSSYTMKEADISNYFEGLRKDFEAACYGMYFLELAGYYTRENADETEMLKLLYQSLKALVNENLENELIRYIYEMRAMVINGEFPGVPEEGGLDPSTVYAVSYVMSCPIARLYTFTVSENVLKQLSGIMEGYRKKYMDRKMKSLEILRKLLVENPV